MAKKVARFLRRVYAATGLPVLNAQGQPETKPNHPRDRDYQPPLDGPVMVAAPLFPPATTSSVPATSSQATSSTGQSSTSSGQGTSSSAATSSVPATTSSVGTSTGNAQVGALAIGPGPIARQNASTAPHRWSIPLQNLLPGQRTVVFRLENLDGTLINQRLIGPSQSWNSAAYPYIDFTETLEGVQANGTYRVKVWDTELPEVVAQATYTTAAFTTTTTSSQTSVLTISDVIQRNPTTDPHRMGALLSNIPASTTTVVFRLEKLDGTLINQRTIGPPQGLNLATYPAVDFTQTLEGMVENGTYRVKIWDVDTPAIVAQKTYTTTAFTASTSSTQPVTSSTIANYDLSIGAIFQREPQTNPHRWSAPLQGLLSGQRTVMFRLENLDGSLIGQYEVGPSQSWNSTTYPYIDFTETIVGTGVQANGTYRVKIWDVAVPGEVAERTYATNAFGVTAPQAGQRAVLFHTGFDANQGAINNVLDKPVDGVLTSLFWYELQSAPGVWRTAARDNLLAMMQRAKETNKKVMLEVWPVRRIYNDGTPQDYQQFFGEADLARYHDGTPYTLYANYVANWNNVQPHFASQTGVAAVRRFYKELTQLLAPYVADGTLVGLLPISGREGELTYPYNHDTGQVSGYSDGELASLRAELQTQYATIGALNTAWGTAYAGFGNVPWPVMPTSGAMQFGISDQKGRDWLRHRNKLLRAYFEQCRAGIREVTNSLKAVLIQSSLGGGFQHNIAFSATNLGYWAGAGIEAAYSTAGGGTSLSSKLAALETHFGTFGANLTTILECDTDDWDTQNRTGGAAQFDNGPAVVDAVLKAFDKGLQYWVLRPIGSWNWGAVTPFIQQVRTQRINGGQTITARNPQATANYNYTTLLTGDGNAYQTLWNSLNGATRQVNVVCVDDLVGTSGSTSSSVAPTTSSSQAPTTSSSQSPDAGGNDVFAWNYEAADGYGNAYDPSAKFGTFLWPVNQPVRFINEAGLLRLRGVWHKWDFKATQVGHASLYAGEYGDSPLSFELSNNFANAGLGGPGFYEGAGFLSSYAGETHPDNPQNVTEQVLDTVVFPRIPYVGDIRLDVEIANPTPAQRANPDFMKHYINAMATGILRRAKARNQRVYFYGVELYGLTRGGSLPQAGYKPADFGGVSQAQVVSFGGRNGDWDIRDPLGQNLFDLCDYPSAADLQVIDAFYTSFRFVNNPDAFAPNVIATNLIRATVPSTGQVNAAATRPTRYRVERLPGSCGSGSTTFRFTLEDEQGNRVPNWQSGQTIPASILNPYNPSSGQMVPLEGRIYCHVNYNNFSPNYQVLDASAAIEPGSAVAEVCIRNQDGNGQPATPISTLDLQTECDVALIKAHAQIEANKLFHPTSTPNLNTAPTPHGYFLLGWLSTGKYPDFYLPRLVSMTMNLQGNIWQWGIGCTHVSNRPVGAGQDEVTAMLKRVHGRIRFTQAGVKRSEFGLEWPVNSGNYVWTKRTESVPGGGDANRYDAYWVMQQSTGTFPDNSDFHDLDGGRRALVNVVPLLTVAQQGGEVLIEGHLVGRIAETDSRSYQVRVRDARNAANEKTFSISFTGKQTTRIVRSL